MLMSVFLSALFASGCLEALPWFGSPVVYPRIVPVEGGAMPPPAVYTFPFQDRNVVVDTPVDAAVYAGARVAEKSARVYDHSIAEEVWRAGIYQALIGDTGQDGFYSRLLSLFRVERNTRSLDQDEYAELLAVFVQSIPYESQNLTSPRFPVETYVDGLGDCDDKSLLLAGLLSREGYRTALLYFDQERHMAVGIGCDEPGYQGTGYAYIETTNVSLVGIPPRELAGGIRLTSLPTVIPVGDGTLNYTRCRETAELWQSVKETERELALLETDIRNWESILQGMKDRLDSQKASMEQMLSRGDTGGYNMRIPGYNAQVQEYNRLRADLLEVVNRFNRLAGVHNYLITHQYDRKGTYAWLAALPGM
jgi:hypothetical protein